MPVTGRSVRAAAAAAGAEWAANRATGGCTASVNCDRYSMADRPAQLPRTAVAVAACVRAGVRRAARVTTSSDVAPAEDESRTGCRVVLEDSGVALPRIAAAAGATLKAFAAGGATSSRTWT